MTTNEDIEEIYLERARYLLSADDVLEQTLENRYNIIHIVQTNKKISQEIGQQHDIRIETEIPLVFAFNF